MYPVKNCIVDECLDSPLTLFKKIPFYIRKSFNGVPHEFLFIHQVILAKDFFKIVYQLLCSLRSSVIKLIAYILNVYNGGRGHWSAIYSRIQYYSLTYIRSILLEVGKVKTNTHYFYWILPSLNGVDDDPYPKIYLSRPVTNSCVYATWLVLG